MDSIRYQESLRLLSKIIQLFSLTKNLSREQWEILANDFWNVLVKEIACVFPENPLVQIRELNSSNKKIILASSRAEKKTESCLETLVNGSVFSLSNKMSLYIDLPYSKIKEEDKAFLYNLVEHLRISQEWRESLEKGFEIQKRIGLLHKITVSIRGSLELSEVLAKTARDLGKSLKISRCFIRRYDPMNKGRVLATEQEFTQPGIVKAADIIFDFETEWMKNLNIPEDDKEGQFKEFLYIPNVSELDDPEEFIKCLAEEIALVTFLAIPLIYKNQILGCLCFHQCGEERVFDSDELDFIRQVAAEATGAIIHAQMYEQIQDQARTDSLTGLYNKSHFHEALEKEIERSSRAGTHVSLMMIDLDYLKRANDTYGHIVGDEIIKILGDKLRQTLRQIDIIARFGGDEFGVILPDTPLEGAKQLGERLIKAVLSAKHPLVGNLSASVGVSSSTLVSYEKEILIESADQALYMAKKRGKSQVCFADDEELLQELINQDIKNNQEK